MDSRILNQEKENLIILENYKGKSLFFSGIGGCSMSGLAQICASQGYIVSGSDRNKSPFTHQLESANISVVFEQKSENIKNIDLLIYSAAIKEDHPERMEATRQGIPQMERSVLLGKLSSHYKKVVCIAGAHGKTSITSMLALICMYAKLDPTVHVGGMVSFLNGGGVQIGQSDIFITEACEYVESFMTLSPTMISLSNIDDDHLDYFNDINHITNTFSKFIDLMPDHQPLIGCTDDPRLAKLLEEKSKRYSIISYGLQSGDYMAKNIKILDNGSSQFEVFFKNQLLLNAQLNVPGLHNVNNALCAIILARELNADIESITSALADYKLTKRRFEYYGDVKGISIYHDYAHHPTEIKACLQGARSVCKNKLWVVFQCNSYTRAKTLFSKNVSCFSDADKVIVPDIYPGREIDMNEIHARDIQKAIQQNDVDCQYIPTFEEIGTYIREHGQPGDLVVTLGSGDVYIQTKKLL